MIKKGDMKMKKKIIVTLLLASMAFTMWGCGNQTKPAKTTEQSKEQDQEKDLPEGDYQDTGSGTMFLSTPGGTSENGDVPVIYVSDEILLQIGLDTLDFDSSKLSFIYIDGMLYGKEQLGESQISLDLSENSLSVGKHSVEVLQYEGDSPENTMVTYKSASYEVKSK